MSKSGSGLFSGTSGNEYKDEKFAYSNNEPTAVVWEKIAPTAQNYPGTEIPRSFIVDVPSTKHNPEGKLWTHGNATEHMHEALTSIKDNPRLKVSNPNLYSQFILYDYYKALNAVCRGEINYNRTYRIGNWEFAFSEARSGQKYPVVKHALFTGFKE